MRGTTESNPGRQKGQFLLLEIDTNDATSKDHMKVAEELNTKYEIVEEPDHEELGMAWDDVSGAELDPGKIRKLVQRKCSMLRRCGYTKRCP